jgi:hypothetical protein
MGAAALFPWYLAIAIAVLVVGLASACAYQFRVTQNPLYLVAMCLMTALASFLDGVSVWELLNETQNSGLHAAAAHEGALDDQLKSTQQEADAIRAKIATVVQEYTNMDNDGNGTNDGLIPGKIALAESLKADLANVQSRVDELQSKTIEAASTTAVTDGERHILLQMADEHQHPARWLIMWASVVFLIPEFTLALLAWSMHSGGRREEEGLKVHSDPQTAGRLIPAHLAQQHAQWLVQQQHLHALHSMTHAFPSMNAGSSPVPVPQVSHLSGEQVTEWGGTMVQPGVGTHMTVASRTSSVSSASQEAAPTVPVSTQVFANSLPVQAPSAPVEQVAQAPVSPLAAINGHPGLIHHTQPDGLSLASDGFEVESSSREESLASPSNSSGVLSLREAKKRRFLAGSATKHHKQKGRKARDLNQLAASLPRLN